MKLIVFIIWILFYISFKINESNGSRSWCRDVILADKEALHDHEATREVDGGGARQVSGSFEAVRASLAAD